jgi:hypothetical protein
MQNALIRNNIDQSLNLENQEKMIIRTVATDSASFIRTNINMKRAFDTVVPLILLLFSLLQLPTAYTYTVSVPFQSQYGVMIHLPSNDVSIATTTKATTTLSYPISSRDNTVQPNASMHDSRRINYILGPETEDISTATQYLVEHESVHEYPSPLLWIRNNNDIAELPVVNENEKITKKMKKQHPPLIPNRLTDDSELKILQPSHSSSSFVSSSVQQQSSLLLPNTMPIPRVLVQPAMRSGQSFDINTAWIELLIHEQQMKLSTSTSSPMVHTNLRAV